VDLDVDDEAAGSGERQAEAAVTALCSDPPSSFALALDIGEARCAALRICAACGSQEHLRKALCVAVSRLAVPRIPVPAVAAMVVRSCGGCMTV